MFLIYKHSPCIFYYFDAQKIYRCTYLVVEIFLFLSPTNTRCVSPLFSISVSKCLLPSNRYHLMRPLINSSRIYIIFVHVQPLQIWGRGGNVVTDHHFINVTILQTKCVDDLYFCVKPVTAGHLCRITLPHPVAMAGRLESCLKGSLTCFICSLFYPTPGC